MASECGYDTPIGPQSQMSLQRVTEHLTTSFYPKSSEKRTQLSDEADALIKACREDALYGEGQSSQLAAVCPAAEFCGLSSSSSHTNISWPVIICQHAEGPDSGEETTDRDTKRKDFFDNFQTSRPTFTSNQAERSSNLNSGQTDFFTGCHPSRLSQVANRGDSNLTAQSQDDNAQKAGQSESSISAPSYPQRNMATAHEKEKKTKNGHAGKMDPDLLSKNPLASGSPQLRAPYVNPDSNVVSVLNLQRNFGEFPNHGAQLVIDGIENLKKRYAHLNLASPSGKEWFFAWQEIIATLRTPSSYCYKPWRSGYSIQLNTDFKVFRLRGPFGEKHRGRDLITRTAVLHVLDGPYFFKRAAPALEDFCRDNNLPRPQYKHHLHPDGTCACHVHVGRESNIFGDEKEGYASREEAQEDVAKKAMNAIHREGLLLYEGPATSDEPNVIHEAFGNNQRVEKRKAPEGFHDEDFRRVSARGNDGNDRKVLAFHRTSDAETGQVGTVKSEVNDNDETIDKWPTWRPIPCSSLTRAGLAKVLEGVSEAQDRVKAMCEYLKIKKPEYVMERQSGEESWSAYFEQTTDNSRAGTRLAMANNLQGCARVVEQKLFEKIYNGEIHLGDGDAKFPDPAMDLERVRQGFARLSPNARKRREKDEGLTLEEIARRHEVPDEIVLPPSAYYVPLGVSRRPLVRKYGSDENMDDHSVRNEESARSDPEPRLLPSGELPYVSPPPFLDTQGPSSIEAEIARVKVEPLELG